MGRAVGTIQPGDEKPFNAGGHYLTVVKSKELLEIELVRDHSTIETHLVKQGTTLYEKNFSSIVVKNEGSSAADVIIVTGVGKYRPSQDGGRVEIDTTGGSVPVTMDESQLNLQVNQQTTGAINNGLASVTLATGETKKLCDVNPLRKYVKMNILGLSDCEYVTVGGELVDDSSGFALERGVVNSEETTAALWAHNPNDDVVVWLMEVTD